MARTPTEMDRPGGDLAPQSQGGSALDRNGFYTASGLPSRAPIHRPNPLRGLILPLVVAIVCGAGAFVVSNFYMTRWYTSSTTILFPATASQSGLLNSLLGNSAGGPATIPIIGPYTTPQYGTDANSAILVLDSGRTKGEVMNSLHLAQRWHLTPDQAAARFNKNVTFLVDKDGLLMLQASDTNPHLAQKIVNTYVKALRDVSTQLSTETAHDNVVALSQKYEAAQEKLARHENDLVALQERMARTMPLGMTVTVSYADLVNQETAAQTDLSATNAEIAAQIQTAKKTYGSNLNLPTSVAFSNSTIQELDKARADFATVSAEYGPAYPGYREAQDRVTQAEQQAKTELQRQYAAVTQFITPDMTALYVKRQSLQARLDNLRQVAAERRTAMVSLPDAQRREADLNHQIALDNITDTTLAQAVTQAELIEKRDVPMFTIMDAAGVPGEPSLPRVGYTTALAAIAGFLLTLAWLAARAHLGQPTSQEQMRRWTDAYGLTERDAVPQALSAEASATLPERSAPQLSQPGGAASSSTAPRETVAADAEDTAGSPRQ
jgi:uncharacterized protein involved in exopolysaccharide biosynthesis